MREVSKVFTKASVHHSITSIVRLFFVSFFLSQVLQVNTLEASGWGKTKEVMEYEGESWNSVYLDMNKLYFTAFIPNYSGATLQNSNVSITGQVKKDISYVITTPYDLKFNSPKTARDFIKIIQNANPDFIVTAIEGKKLRTKYGADLRPKKPGDTVFWRIVFAHNRLINMGTNDSNENRRHKFFESIRVTS
jgi:hypothetical protein